MCIRDRVYTAKKNVDLFVKHGIYTKEEINARAEIHIENYTTVLTIEARTMADMLRRQILPAVSGYAAELCERGWKKEQMGVGHKADDVIARELGCLLYTSCGCSETPKAAGSSPASARSRSIFWWIKRCTTSGRICG